jgi:putative peptide zinc metalloprotease protein
MQPRLLFNPAVSIFHFDSNTKEEMVMCEIPTQTDVPLRYALPTDLIGLLKSFDGSTDSEQAIANYNHQYPGRYTPEKLGRLVAEFFCPKGLLIDPDAPVVPAAIVSKHRSYLYVKIQLVPAGFISLITPWLGWLFKKGVFVAWLLILFAVHLVFYLKILPEHQFNLNNITGTQLISIMLLASVTAFVHEWGHASAFKYYGCKKAEIGWGIYLFFSVFYTDVSEAWKLNRKQRAMIDIAGVYFQSLCLLILLGLFWATKAPIFLYTVFLVNIEIAGAMNPFLRTDGYWLVTDLFGIPNLRKQSLEVLKFHATRLLRSKKEVAIEPFANLSRKTKWALYSYVLFCVAFAALLCKIMINQFVYNLIPGYPHHVVAVWMSIQEQPISFLKVVGALFDLLWRTVALLGLCFFLYNLLSGIWRFLRRALSLLTEKFLNELLKRRQSAT